MFSIINKSLNRKLIVIVLTISIIPLMLVFSYTYFYFKSQSIKANLAIQELNMQNTFNNMQLQFDNMLAALIDLSKDEILSLAMDTKEHEEVNNYLEKFIQKNHSFSSVIITDLSGNIFSVNNGFGSGQVSDKKNIFLENIDTPFSFFDQINKVQEQGLSLFNTYTTKLGELKTFYIYTPIKDFLGNRKGYLLGFVSFNYIEDLLKSAQHELVERGYKTIIFQLIENRTEKNIYQYPKLKKQSEKFSWNTLKQQQKIKYAKTIWHFHKREVSLKNNAISIISLISETDILKSAHEMLKITLFLLSFMAIIIYFIILFMARSITSSLIKIINMLRNIAQGKYAISQKIVIKGTDEVSKLAEAYNEMLDSFNTIINHSNNIAQGDFSHSFVAKSKDDTLGIALEEMTSQLRSFYETNNAEIWLKDGQTQLTQQMRGEQVITDLAKNVITFICRYLDIFLGAIYLFKEKSASYNLIGSYAFIERKGVSNEFKLGQGIIGQVGLEKQQIVFSDIPDDYIKIQSGLGKSKPKYILALPFIREGKAKGVIELASITPFTDRQQKFLNQVTESIAIAFHTAESRNKMELLLEQTQNQSLELQQQQAALKVTNDRLIEQTKVLKSSEENLKAQQEELQVANEELEEKTNLLESQRNEIELANVDLQRTKKVLEEKAEELTLASKYKSEFLANMSHELRTPLNSVIILSKVLMDNKLNNLNPTQIESAETIYHSAYDLLSLINDILDLSKIESGKMSLNISTFKIDHLITKILRTFTPVAEKKQLKFSCNIADNCPALLTSDEQRVYQILKNLLSNAMKFTEQGQISLEIAIPDNNVDLSRSGIKLKEVIAFKVKDTGVGIPEDKLKLVFEAFQQADGSTSRKYGGTGLGLSISRELANLLKGEIQLHSEEGRGSEFTLYLPLTIENNEVSEAIKEGPSKFKGDIFSVAEGLAENLDINKLQNTETEKKSLVSKTNIIDDRENIKSQDTVILIIEDDQKFAGILMNMAKEKGFKVLIAFDGETGITLLNSYHPHALMLDIFLPGISGWMVMDALTKNSDTRHIPVHFISGVDYKMDALKRGAVGFLQKPVDPDDIDEAFNKIQDVIKRNIKDLFIVDDDEVLLNSIVALVDNSDIRITKATSGSEAIEYLQKTKFDCIILDLGLSDISGFEVLKKMQDFKINQHTPVLIYTGKDLSKDEVTELKKYSQSIIVKDINSEERLLDETNLFLHRVEADLPKAMQKKIQGIHDQELVLKNKTVLVVDDDMRNTFSLEVLLNEYGLNVIMAENGLVALEQLKKHTEINLVLMDIMMPKMNGYEAMKIMRKDEKYKDLPIIAVTANAMLGDRKKCIEAGANDYLAKPVEYDKLISLMRIWLR